MQSSVTMNPELEVIVAGLKSRLGDAVKSVETFRDDTVVMVDKQSIVEAVSYLRMNESTTFPLCEDVFGIDMFVRKDRFRVSYHFYSVEKKLRIHLSLFVDEKDLHVPTITEVYPSANWYEREAYDMFGIIFDNHPDLRRAYMPEDFEYYPLRKDFPLMGIPGSIPLPKRS
jgi:NADH-quinone oxidoreductase subunit C